MHNTTNSYAVIPKLPKLDYASIYNSQQNMKPSDYYTTALGFLPIDTRYMVNPKNSLTYNSMADVLFNNAAHAKRWDSSATPWMNEWWATPLRLVVDTILLGKDTILDPIANGITEDGLSGFLRGGSTAVMNTLVNLGNTLDVVSNPIKGAILEGSDGFVKGLFGDEHGRKQYDYIDHVNTGNGFGDFALSLGFEILSDPLNWISFGGKALVSSGAKDVAGSITKTISDELTKQIGKNIDEVVDTLADTSKFLSKDTAKTVLESVAGESRILTKEAVDDLTSGLQPLLTKTITRAEAVGSGASAYNKLATSVGQSKGPRYKASFFSRGIETAPAAQTLASNYLRAAAENTPDMLLPSMSKKVALGSTMYKGSEGVQRALRYTAGAAGFDWFVGGYKIGNNVVGKIRNELALRDPGVVKTLDKMYKQLDTPTIRSAINELSEKFDPVTSETLLTNALDIHNKFNKLIYDSTFTQKSVQHLVEEQAKLVSELDDLVKGLNIPDVNTFADYIKSLENSNVTLKSSDVAKLIDQYNLISKHLSEDFTDKAVRLRYRRANIALRASLNKFASETQGGHMAKLDAELREWNRTHGSAVTEALEKHADNVDEAINVITKEKFVDDLRSKLIPRTLDALTASKQHTDVIDSFKAIWEDFNDSLKAFDANPNDIGVRNSLVQNYNALEERIKSFTEVNTSDLNINNATQFKNKLGVAALENSNPSRTVYELSKQDEAVLKRAAYIEKQLAEDTDYKTMRAYYTEEVQKDSYYFKKDPMEISKAVDKELASYIDLKYGKGAAETLEKARKARILIMQSDPSDFTLKELSDAIEALPSFQHVKDLNTIISPEDVAKYQLVVYSIMNRRASFLHLMLGLEQDGSAAYRVLESIDRRVIINKYTYDNATVGDFFTYLKQNNRLPKNYNSAVGVSKNKTADYFVSDIRRAAKSFLERTALHDNIASSFLGYSWLDLDAYARTNSTFKKIWDEYNTTVDYGLVNANILKQDPTKFTAELNDVLHKLKEVLNKQLENQPKLTHVNSAHTLHLRQQAKALLDMSDNEIKSFATFGLKNNYSHPEAYLNNLLKEYEDVNSDLYKLLNSAEALEDSVQGSTIKAAQELFTRLQGYKTLVNNVTKLVEANGLPNFYTEALLDQVVTQLSKRGRLAAEYVNLDKITKEIMDGVNLFIRNRFNAPALAMDRVLWQTINEFSSTPHAPAEAIAATNRIRARLNSGLAHGAVVDVDNLSDLLILSKYSDDPRLKGILSELQTAAKGRKVVVFDIESTGAIETASHIFQISGKVLNADGTEVIGQNFNFIIKPPKGIKPTPNVLKVITPDGLDPTDWWNNNIVNAVSNDTQLVFDNIEDAIKAFTEHCNKQGPVIFAGHNIKSYDIPALIKRTALYQQSLKNVEVFDTMRFMNNKTVFQLTEEQERLLSVQLKTIFENLRAEDSAVLKNVPFSGSDIRTLSDLKNIFKDSSAKSAHTISKTEKNSFNALGLENIDETTGTPWGYSIVSNNFAERLEHNISGIVDEWRSPSKINGNHFYVVSKLNPDVLNDTAKALYDDLTKQGLINVPLGKNIMQYFTGGVAKGNIVINPVKVLSYEAADVFDFKKALDVYKVAGKDNVLRIQDMAKLTSCAKHINNLKWIPADYIESVVDDARNLLKHMSDNALVKCLYEDADNITIVATAIYLYNRLEPDSVLKQMSEYTHFGDIGKKIADIRGLKKPSTPILNQIDDRTGLPRFMFEDDDYFSYDKIVDVIKHDTYFDSMRAYNVDNNLYNAYNAAKHAMFEPIVENAKAVNKYLNSLSPEALKTKTAALKSYNSALDSEAVSQILNRTNRVEVLKSEMYARGGYVCFDTYAPIDLTDFKAADSGFVVVDNIAQNNGRYVQFICATRETFNAAKDVDLGLNTVKGVAGIDDELFKYIVESRELAANNGIKNIGYSHGDLINTEMIDMLQDALIRQGVSENTIRTLVNVDDLTAAGFFNTLRANNSIIGDRFLWQFVSDDVNVHYIADPFKQMCYSTHAGITTMRQDLILYSSLILNKHSDINTAALYKALPDKELYKLLKDNPDMCMAYITHSKYWDRTKSGFIVKEFNLADVASITKARAMGGIHIIPRTQAAQVMKAVNEFDLPPIAKIAKGISDVYKVAFLGSLGFIVRNLIDSNFKTYASMDGMVSLPKSVKHFFQSLGIVRKHTSIGQEYTKAMGKYFSTDLEYEVFYKYCNSAGDDGALEDIIANYPEKLQARVASQLEELSEKFSSDLISNVKPNLMQPEMFTIVDSFIKYGPSAGLSKTVLENIPTAKGFDDKGILNKFNKWVTQDTPMRFVYGTNDYIEQAARLSMYLQRLELGDTIDDANKAVIKAHFDYSDKSIGMIYTEILFPFMSFSYKNLNFWVEMMYENPMLVGQMNHIFRTIFDYQGLFEPDQGAYEAYDYTFDWSKDIMSFESSMPWTQINAARLYHLLNGNILIKSNKNIQHDFGYGKGEQETELYNVFKLSPSVLDATKMLFHPLNAYSERLLPPVETMVNIFKGLGEGKNVTEQMSVASLANMLPYFDTMLQRVGRDENNQLRHNNLYQRIEDAGIHQAIPSIFGAAYVPVKDSHYWYDSDYNILGGLKTNYYAKKNYSNPYNSKYPSYTLTRMAQNNRRPKSIYAKSKSNNMIKYQYNSVINTLSYQNLLYRLKDYQHYY